MVAFAGTLTYLSWSSYRPLISASSLISRCPQERADSFLGTVRAA